MSASPNIRAFFDEPTNTVSYLVWNPGERRGVVIDPVLDFDPASGTVDDGSVEEILKAAEEVGIAIEWVLETHVHADHLTAAPYLKEKLGGQTGIGKEIATVQKVFGKLFNAGPGFAKDGSQFDRLFADDEEFTIGTLKARAMHTPGHTPACLTYVISDERETAAFVGDTLFMPDYGTARCDFPGGDARTLFRSINKVLSLPAETRLYMCHDYRPGGREVQFVTTVAEEREMNIHVRNGISEEEFVAMRTARDATLEMPVLILPSVQVNMRAGHLPEPEDNGQRYLKIPINAL